MMCEIKEFQKESFDYLNQFMNSNFPNIFSKVKWAEIHSDVRDMALSSKSFEENLVNTCCLKQ